MRYSVSLLLALLSLTAFADHHLSMEQAMVRVGLTPSASTMRKAQAGSHQRYYVFNREEGGFVIASADDRARAILGYCDEGEWDPNNIPPAMQGWLESMTEALELLAKDQDETLRYENEDESQVGQRRRAAATRVEPLLGGIKWGQNTPFNNLCPAVGATHSATGCAATAMAQIMRYHRWPEHGYGSHSYDTSTIGGAISEDFSTTTYDWANMLEQYFLTVDGRPNNYNETQAKAVATLMYHVGVAFSMDYNTGASGTTEGPMLDGIIQNFNYDKGLQIYYRENYTSEEWYAMLQSEIDAKRPVLMNGYSLSGGHAFVIDGYDTSMGDSYFHFNWGWNGMSDGYYSVDITDPGQQGTGGSLGGYSYNQNIFVGLQKPCGGEARPNLCVSAAIRYSYGQLHFQFLNRGTGTFSGQAGYAIDKGNGNVQFVPKDNYSIGFRQGSGSVHMTPVAPTAAGWRYYVAYKDGSNIVPMRTIVGANPALVSISDGKGGYTLAAANEEAQLNCKSIKTADAEVYAGTTAYFSMEVENVGPAEYNGALYLSMTDLYDDGQGGYIEGYEERATDNPLGVYLRPGRSNTYSFPYYGGLASGHYRVRLMYNPRNGAGLQYVPNSELDITVVPYQKPVTNPPSLRLTNCELSAETVAQYEFLSLSVTVNNTGGDDMVRCGGCIFTEKGNVPIAILGEKVYSYPKGETTLEFRSRVTLEPGRYRLLFGWEDSGWWEYPNYSYKYFEVTPGNPTAIDAAVLSTATERVTDMQGRSCVGRPKSGLYIQGGRKLLRR